MPTLITQTEAAELKNVSLHAIQRAIREQRLTVYERYGKRLLDQAEVNRYQPNGSQAKGRESRGKE